MTENQEVKKRTQELTGELSRQLHVRRAALLSFNGGYDPQRLLRAVADASLDKPTDNPFENRQALPAAGHDPEPTPSGLGENSELFDLIRAWRAKTALEKGIPAFTILHNSVAMDIARHLPSSSAELRKIKGIGAMKIIAYGEALLELVREYRGKELREPEVAYRVGELASEKISS